MKNLKPWKWGVVIAAVVTLITTLGMIAAFNVYDLGSSFALFRVVQLVTRTALRLL